MKCIFARYLNLCFVIIAFTWTVQVQALPQVVAFLGPKRVGKDTAVDYLTRTYGYKKYALADPMKKAVQQLFHLSDQQLWGDEKEIIDLYWGVTPRELMQFIGIEMLYDGLGNRFPQIGNSFCIRSLEHWREQNPEEIVAISDLRMQEDVDALKKMGAFIIRIDRPSLAITDQHVSEANVPSVVGYDVIIINDGTIEDLEHKIELEMRGQEMNNHIKWKLNTSNQGKFEEFKSLFASQGCTLEATHHDLDEIQADAVQVVAHKASQMEECVLVEDTSLVIEGADIGVNVRWLLDRLPEYIGRKAVWEVLLAYRKGEQVYVYQGAITGRIVPQQGEKGFGFDPVFMPEEAGKTLAEDKPDCYNARALAVQAFLENKVYKIMPVIKEWQGPWQQ